VVGSAKLVQGWGHLAPMRCSAVDRAVGAGFELAADGDFSGSSRSGHDLGWRSWRLWVARRSAAHLTNGTTG
jgi:hypothetical protein